MIRDWNEIDAADELRRIGPMFTAAVHELSRRIALEFAKHPVAA